jgi:hypothetical protein
LLVALAPVLLMLAAVGLERLESGLGREPSIPATFPFPTKSDESGRADRNGRPDPVDDLQRRLQQRRMSSDTWPGDTQSERLPTLPYIRHSTKTGFQATGHANSV